MPGWRADLQRKHLGQALLLIASVHCNMNSDERGETDIPPLNSVAKKKLHVGSLVLHDAL
jgi:hypothetical protein